MYSKKEAYSLFLLQCLGIIIVLTILFSILSNIGAKTESVQHAINKRQLEYLN